jgi:integrase
MDYPKAIKISGAKTLYFFYTDPITGKRRKKSTGETGPRKARQMIEAFIDDIYDLRIHQPKPLRTYLDMFASPETNPKYQEAQITDAHYTLGHAKAVAGVMKYLRDHVLAGTSYLIRDMKDFTAVDIRRIAQMIVDSSGKTRKSQNLYIQLKALFNYAADNHEILYSPAAKLRNLTYEEQHRTSLSLAALQLIVSRRDLHQSDQAHAFIAFAAMTGLRRGELIALHTSQFSDSYLLVNQSFDDATGALKETKTYHDRRIPLAAAACTVIQPYLDQEIVFRNGEKMVHTRSVANWYAGFREAAAADKDLPLEIREEIAGSSLHALRHSLATHLRFSGIHDSVVRAYMGWELSRDKDMLERYTHATDYLQGCADLIDNLFSGKIIEMPGSKKA